MKYDSFGCAYFVSFRSKQANYKQLEKQANVNTMLSMCGLKFEGREHSGTHLNFDYKIERKCIFFSKKSLNLLGIDDSRNIARIVSWLIKDGCKFNTNMGTGSPTPTTKPK